MSMSMFTAGSSLYVPGSSLPMSTPVLTHVTPIVKEGLLFKRGERIKNWRSRYFYLFANGSLIGFKEQPSDPFTTEPHNDFTVEDSQIMKMDRPKPFTFMIRGLERTRVIERLFYADTEQDRQQWIYAIENVAETLKMMSSVSVFPLAGSSKFSSSLGNYSSELSGGMLLDFCSNDQELYDKFSVQNISSRSLYGKKKVTFENFEFLKLLGKGAFGKVILCREKASGKLYAVKILRKDVIIDKKEVSHTLTENRVLQTTNHPFLISLKCSFQTNERLCFVTEYVNGGELYFHLAEDKIFSEERTRFYGAEIISAIGYLHQKGIIYRDLKLENLLLDKDGHIKVADFGMCKQDITYHSSTDTLCGTPEYLAPEVLGNEHYSLAVDWWGVGVVMYEMMVGRLPFYNSNRDKMFELIVLQDVRFPSTLSHEAKDLLRGLLKKDPLERLGGGPEDVKEVMQHIFFGCIDWDDLVQKKISPPFKPQVSSDVDTRYFDIKFTTAPVELTPPDNDGLLGRLQDANDKDFDGFSHRAMSTTQSLCSLLSEQGARGLRL